MKINEYKTFKAKLVRAKDNDVIWNAGFLFINLTRKQANDLYDTMYNRYGVGDEVKFPNGFSIRRS